MVVNMIINLINYSPAFVLQMLCEAKFYLLNSSSASRGHYGGDDNYFSMSCAGRNFEYISSLLFCFFNVIYKKKPAFSLLSIEQWLLILQGTHTGTEAEVCAWG